MKNFRLNRRFVLLPVCTLALLGSSAALAARRGHVDIVGSSTVYPFSTVVAETYSKKTGNRTPKVESTGSGGGIKLFCAGTGIKTPDIANASRRIKKSEFANCQANGVKEIIEVPIGFDGITIANAKNGPDFDLSERDLFLALARKVPADQPGQLIDNPYTTWQQVNPSLPAVKIEVLGPPPTSGTRDAFVELALEGGCKTFDWIGQIKADAKAAKKAGDNTRAETLKNQYKTICHSIREDGAYIEAGENDNLIVDKLVKNPKALGIFGFSFLDQNSDKVKGAHINGVPVSFENIANGSYPISRPLFFYIKKSHLGKIPGLQGYINEFTSEDAWGDEGYLTDKGLIPLPATQRQRIARQAREAIPMAAPTE